MPRVYPEQKRYVIRSFHNGRWLTTDSGRSYATRKEASARMRYLADFYRTKDKKQVWSYAIFDGRKKVAELLR